MQKQGMHPELIKAAIRMAGITPAALADEMGVAHSSITQVINGRTVSARIRKRIAHIIGKPAAAIWPPSTRPSMRRTRSQMRTSTRRASAAQRSKA